VVRRTRAHPCEMPPELIFFLVFCGFTTTAEPVVRMATDWMAEKVGLCGPSMGLTPTGPACGCPNSFQTNLSNRTSYWRREWDSNPRWYRYHGGFQDRCLKPLGHLSEFVSARCAGRMHGGFTRASCPRPCGADLRSFWIVPDDPVKTSAIDHSATLPNASVRYAQRVRQFVILNCGGRLRRLLGA
jgi:hypothetical protein